MNFWFLLVIKQYSAAFQIIHKSYVGSPSSLILIFCNSSRPRSEQSLVRWATPQLHDIDALSKMVDPTLKGLYPVKSLSRFADVIALCVQVWSATFFIHTKYTDYVNMNWVERIYLCIAC